ncbi:hypothetical protein [Streptomyces sp. KL116D]|uniref:hypothetical protein n=1 Tax=Streptomyces sp. KL116D TaxID=3045152 RepID=UPI00355657A6
MSASNLPEQCRRYAAPLDEQPLTGPVELYGEREAVVWVPERLRRHGARPQVAGPGARAAGRPCATWPRSRFWTPSLSASSAPAPGADSCCGEAGSSRRSERPDQQPVRGGVLLLFLAVACTRAVLAGRGRTYVHHEQHTHVHQKWLGRTNIHNQ